MKKLIFLLGPVLMLFLYACSMEEEISPDPDADAMLKKAPVPVNVFTVCPGGGDDTEALIAAFDDAKAAGPGATVKLTEGEFHIGFVTVEDFEGSFTGAGMGKTIILPLPVLPWEDLYAQNLAWELIKFLRGNMQISNMSFRNLEGDPCPGYDLWGFLGLHDYAYTELPGLDEGHQLTAMVDHVEFVSHPDPVFSGWSPYTVQCGIGIGPDYFSALDIPHCANSVTVTNCSFSEMTMAVSCGNNEQGRTVFSNNKPVETDDGLWIGDNIGGSCLVSGNEFHSDKPWGQGVWINDALFNNAEFKLSDGCQYEISGNVFHLEGEAILAVCIEDNRKALGIIDNENPLQVLIKSNLFDLQANTWVGIWNWMTDDVVIRNNKFTGQAGTGIYVDPTTTNSLMLGNNFSSLVCSQVIDWLPGSGEGYNILLFGNDNTVVGGGNNSTTVLNLGDNNVITGAKFENEGELPPGQTITDNLRSWRESRVNLHAH